MPRMTGYEACRKMKEIEALKPVPVIFLSAKGQESEVQAGLAAGAVEYILKPFAPDQLTGRVNAILEKFSQPQTAQPQTSQPTPGQSPPPAQPAQRPPQAAPRVTQPAPQPQTYTPPSSPQVNPPARQPQQPQPQTPRPQQPTPQAPQTAPHITPSCSPTTAASTANTPAAAAHPAGAPNRTAYHALLLANHSSLNRKHPGRSSPPHRHPIPHPLQPSCPSTAGHTSHSATGYPYA